ncbi:hypothetical protein PG985_009719 [Apiospora marii]|uniref:uncharacterized protein n=1 Tax=Apiospora marii TaxID=335849 RepID=UPI00312EA81A
MAKLQKFDSFMRRSQHLTCNVTTYIRKAVKRIDLSDSTHLPAATRLVASLCRPEPEAFRRPALSEIWRWIIHSVLI